MNITRYSQVINIDVNEVRKLMLKVSEVCNAHLDKAEYDWNKTNASNLMALDEAIAKSNVSMEKFEDSKPSLLPGYDMVSLFDPKIDDFIAIACVIRKSTERLKSARNNVRGIESGIQRVFYETSALLPSLETTINFFKEK